MGDPGYRMEPVGVEKIHQHWVRTYDGFELQAEAIGGLIGESWADPHLTISTGPEPITIERIELQTSHGVYAAEPDNSPIVIPARSSQTALNAYWMFKENTTAPSILGKSARIALHLKVGDVARVAEIEYKRIYCGLCPP